MRGAGGREVAVPEEYDMALSVACSPCPVTKVVSVLSGRQQDVCACVPSARPHNKKLSASSCSSSLRCHYQVRVDTVRPPPGKGSCDAPT